MVHKNKHTTTKHTCRVSLASTLHFFTSLSPGGGDKLTSHTMILTEFRQPLQVQIHLEMSGILVQLDRDRIPSTTPDAEPPRDARDSG